VSAIVGSVSYVQAWVPPTILAQPASTNVNSAAQLLLCQQPAACLFFINGSARRPTDRCRANLGKPNGAPDHFIRTSGAAYSVAITNGGLSITSTAAALTINGVQ